MIRPIYNDYLLLVDKIFGVVEKTLEKIENQSIQMHQCTIKQKQNPDDRHFRLSATTNGRNAQFIDEPVCLIDKKGTGGVQTFLFLMRYMSIENSTTMYATMTPSAQNGKAYASLTPMSAAPLMHRLASVSGNT